MMLDAIALPDSLAWRDEHESQAVAQTVRRALDGSPVVYYSQRRAGRNITLESEEDSGWLSKEQVDALILLASSPGAVYSLVLRQQTFMVVFRHHEPPAFDAQPLWQYDNPQPSSFYRATIKLMTV